MLVLLTLVTGVVYPLAVTGVAQLSFAAQARGSLIVHDGATVGSRSSGKPFSDVRYSGAGPRPPRPCPTTPWRLGLDLGPLNPLCTMR
jgi:K+-transporting ATPase ATPase C chain